MNVCMRRSLTAKLEFFCVLTLCCVQIPVPWSILQVWFLQAIAFMADCEERGLSHNDIKPVSQTF